MNPESAKAKASQGAVPAEERFRLLVEGIHDYAIFMLDPQGNVSSWNAGAERIKGYSARRNHRPTFLTFLSSRRHRNAPSPKWN